MYLSIYLTTHSAHNMLSVTPFISTFKEIQRENSLTNSHESSSKAESRLKEAAAERFWRCAAPLKIPTLGCQQDEVVCMPVRIRLRCWNTPARRERLAHGLKFNSLITGSRRRTSTRRSNTSFFTQHILKQHSHFPGDVVVPNPTVDPFVDASTDDVSPLRNP